MEKSTKELGRRKDMMVIKLIAFYSLSFILCVLLIKLFLYKFLKSIGLEPDSIILLDIFIFVIYFCYLFGCTT